VSSSAWWLARCLRWRNGLVDRCVLRVFTCHCSLIFKLQSLGAPFFFALSLLAPRATRSFHTFFFLSRYFIDAHTLFAATHLFPLLVSLLLLLLLSFAFCAYLHPPSCCVSGYTQLQSSMSICWLLLAVCASWTWLKHTGFGLVLYHYPRRLLNPADDVVSFALLVIILLILFNNY